MNLYGILGHPVSHSLSPAMHNAGFEALGINAEYKQFDVPSNELEVFVRGFARSNLSGFSVTIPHKIAIIPFLDELDAISLKIGAMNTVVNRDGNLLGTNTDGQGAIRALEKVMALDRKKILLVGYGGASLAIAHALAQKKVDVTVIGRSKEKAQLLADKYRFSFDSLNNLYEYHPDVIIQSTSVGMLENISLIPTSCLSSKMIVFDVVYTPLRTKLIQDALNAGCTVITGDKMLLYQAVEQFELWTGVKAPIEIMKRALNESLTAEI